MEQQHSNEWYAKRLYKFTSSQIWKLVTEPREKSKAGQLSETAKTYIIEKITEECGGYIPDINNDAVAWGIEQENQAKLWYEKLTGNTISDVGFCQYSDIYGGSPDSKVFSPEYGNGALEIKCPFVSTHHLKHCLITDQEYFKDNHREYYWQCVSHMITLGVDWCDFVSFDPRIDHEIGFFIIRLKRIEEEVNLLLDKIQKAAAFKKLMRIQLGLDKPVIAEYKENDLLTIIK